MDFGGVRASLATGWRRLRGIDFSWHSEYDETRTVLHSIADSSPAFLLQTPRDGRAFCSLSLVNRERNHCGGVFIADERYSLDSLLASQAYLNRHPKVPRDFAILPFNVLVHHVEDTLSHVQKLSRELTSTEKRIAEGSISLEDNGDYKLLNRLNLEYLRLQRRSAFELELAQNLMKYIDEYNRMWTHLWEGGTSYIEEMKEKIDQQTRYAEQVRQDLDVIPRRIKNQSKAVSFHIVNNGAGQPLTQADIQFHPAEGQCPQYPACSDEPQDCRREPTRQPAEHRNRKGHRPGCRRDEAR